MAIETWMGTLKTKMAAVTGIQVVYTYDDLPGSLMEFPAMVIMPQTGNQEYGASAPAIAIHQVVMTLYVAAQVMPEGYSVAVPFIKKVRDALAACVKLNNLVSYILPAQPPNNFYEGPGGIKYGDKEHLGINFHVDVKEVETVTVTA